MFILQTLRWMCGFVVFELQGGFPERFLNLCAKQKIPIWDVTYVNGKAVGKTTIQGYKRIRDIVRRSGVHMHIVKKTGAPFFFKTNHRRIGLFAGIFVFFMTLWLLSSMVWSVQVVGNDKIPATDILQYAAEQGLKVGARTHRLHPAELAESLTTQFDTLAWAAVNIQFSNVQIEVREQTPKPPMTDVETPANLVAAERGVLTRLDVFAGTAAQKEGSAVCKGDLLISGVMENLDKSERLKSADGHAYALVERPFSFSSETLDVYTCKTEPQRRSLLFFGCTLPLSKRPPHPTFTLERYAKRGNVILPIGIREEHGRSFQKLEKPLPPKTAKRLCMMQLFRFRLQIAKEGKLVEETIQKNVENQGFSVHGMCICEKDIAKKQIIFVEKN